MKKKMMSFLATTLMTVSLTGPLMASPAEDKGYQIMESIEALPTTERSLSEMKFLIYDASEKLVFTKKARSASFTEHYKSPKQRLARGLTYFYSPADDKGNASLLVEKTGQEDDDQWLYLKGLRKPKRVLGSDKSSSFMGSDFSNGDISPPDLDDSTYTWLAEETLSFKGKSIKTQKIKTIMKDKKMQEDYGYSELIAWVHPSSGLAFKTEMYDLQGQLKKTMKLLSFKIVKNKDGKKVFMATGMEVKNQLKGTKTVMKVANIRVGKKAAKVKDNIFALQYLTRKWW